MGKTGKIFSVRPVGNNEDELTALSKFCHELAEFDGHKATVTADKLQKSLFLPNTNIRAFLGFRYDEPIGFILAYECFTVYHGDRGLYVPGAYIIKKYRDKGYGVKLFQFLSTYAVENGFDFMNWIVGANNERANAIYLKAGAEISEGWSYVRLQRML